ncbi:MAG: (2Fe-2S) ferredoxin domain-containing protein [Candidatus Aerophobetes bacterium]
MVKLKPEDLEQISEKMRKMVVLREGAGRARIIVHMGTCGIAAGARKIKAAISALIEEKDAKDVIVTSSGCAGLCSREPMMTVELKGEAPVKYVDLTEEKAREIFGEHVMGGSILTKYALAIGSERVP